MRRSSIPRFAASAVGAEPINRVRATRRVAEILQGSVPHSALADLYRAADVSILASDREGMPNVVLESLACGTPVVATRVGGVPELLTDPVAGVIADSAAPTALAASVRELFARLPEPQRVREFALQFGWDRATNGQLAIFRKLAGQMQDTPASPAAFTGWERPR